MKLEVVGNSAVAADSPDVTEEDLLRAEAELREEVKDLRKRINFTYWDLGRVLYDVYDGVPGGYRALMKGRGSRSERQDLFTKWGYKSFGDYCQREVGLRTRTGENLRYAYYWFAIDQKIDQKVIDQLIPLGRSRIYLLAGVATAKNVGKWIERAKGLTHEDLKKLIKTAKSVANAMNPEAGESPGETMAENGGDDDVKKLPKPEGWHNISASLADAQWDIFQQAIERSKGMSGSDKLGNNITLICQDFLANNDFGQTPDGDKSSYLSKLETMLGVHLIAVDPSSGRPIHGTDLLWRLVNERKNSEPDDGV